MQPIQNIPS